ncbi:xanthotoxin 5-hydroxylase CYP82C4-like [Impatiens glandulifera]|uniref:xanthotoxin 5-hydroxylase CYP82C4-like n=1 Tax=Impatiens glandulifera TaxID=253017 RepID=UPI001FB0BEDA|nr:xanthotoxin 5-hydroxylase CYP82C4-like [Impatiens glandulifera]
MDFSSLDHVSSSIIAGVILFTLLSSSLSLFYYYLSGSMFLFLGGAGDHHKSNIKPPEPSGAWPVLGHLHLLRGTKIFHETMSEMADKHGPIFGIRLGLRRAIVVSNWELAKELSTTHDLAVASRPKLLVAKHLGYNYAMFAFSPYGPYWREIRKFVSLELLSNRRLHLLRHIRVSETKTSIQQLYKLWADHSYEGDHDLTTSGTNGVTVDMSQWISDLIMNVNFIMIFGKRYSGGSDVEKEEARRCQRIFKKHLYLFGMNVVGDMIPWLRWLDIRGHEKAMKETLQEYDQLLVKWLAEHRDHRQNAWKVEGKTMERDFMDVMISMLKDVDIVLGLMGPVQMEGSSTMIRLTNNNWQIWKSKMEDILYCKDLYEPVEGDSAKPKEMAEADWIKLNRKAVGTIRQWLDDSVYHHVASEKSAHELWKKLESLYEQKTAVLGLVSGLDLELEQLDVKTAFLHGQDALFIAMLKKEMSKTFEMKDMGQARQILGMKITLTKATCTILNITGSDTPATMLTWTLCLLMNHHHVLRKVEEELDIHVGKGRNVEESDIPNLVYLQAVIKEALRLCPPAPLGAPREVVQDCVIGGYHVAAGTRLFINMWKIHRDPRIWSEPLEFRPERFMTTHSNIDIRGQNYELIPFGMGRRICPGINFGMTMGHLVLARLLHSFQLSNPNNEPVDMTATEGMSISKATPLEVIITPRLSGHLYA